jgi:hypothetical protein
MSHAPQDERCLGELQLDRLLAGDDDPALRRRLAACAHCQGRLAELQASRDAHMTPAHVSAQAGAIFARLGPAAVAPAPSRTRWRAWLVGAPVLALVAAAAVAVLVLWSRPSEDERRGAGDEIRVKGGARLEVVLVDPAPSRVLSDGDPAPAGATLSFRAACPGGCWVALFAAGDGGVAALADQAPPPWTVAPGGPVQLPVSVTVDDTAGDDRVVAFFCVRPPDVVALRGALEQAQTPVVAGCEVRSQRIARRGPPR